MINEWVVTGKKAFGYGQRHFMASRTRYQTKATLMGLPISCAIYLRSVKQAERSVTKIVRVHEVN